ncbi:unnamed protein product [Prorocentrum cordatum]|uniref:Uncharacterized protein n=1 Tax=Prorocentrum cordatum TaxID=2364126 RepID=A0ABN9WW77_9DINO|nr:unnamed protein product [Polarella glacialis]
MHETTRRGRRSLRERAARARTPGCMHRQALRVKLAVDDVPRPCSSPPRPWRRRGARPAQEARVCQSSLRKDRPDFMLEPAGAMPQTSTAGRTPRKDRGDARSLCGRTAPPARRGNSRSWRKCRSRQALTNIEQARGRWRPRTAASRLEYNQPEGTHGRGGAEGADRRPSLRGAPAAARRQKKTRRVRERLHGAELVVQAVSFESEML